MDLGSATAPGSLIWSRSGPKEPADNSSSLDDEVDIDDEALIRAYERSRKLALSKLQNLETPESKRKPIKSALKSSSTSTSRNDVSTIGTPSITCRWKVGDRCMATYDEDGMPYEAEIIHISKSMSTCTIKYNGYDEEDEKTLDELVPIPQVRNENNHFHHVECETSSAKTTNPIINNPRSCGSCGCMPGPATISQPPQAFMLPPTLSPSALPLLQSPSGPSSSTLHCALMSWYMAGFHTGYHQAVMDLRSASDPKHNMEQSQNASAPSASPKSTCCGGGGPSSANLSNNIQLSRNMTKKPSPV